MPNVQYGYGRDYSFLESSTFFQTVLSAHLSALGRVLDSKVRIGAPKKYSQILNTYILSLSQDLDELPDLDDEDFSSNSAQAPARTEIVKKPANLPMVQVNKETPERNNCITASGS